MNKIKIDNYYKLESKTLRLDEIDYTIIPNSDIKLLLNKLQQENKQLKEDIKNIIRILDKNCDDLEATEEEFESLDRWQNE